VRNVTDVDDSILEFAREHELDFSDLAVSEEAQFASDMAQLNILAPDLEPHATRSMTITVELIQEMRRRGLTYTVDGDIYFHTAALNNFGRLPRYPQELMLALATVSRSRVFEEVIQGDRANAMHSILSCGQHRTWEGPAGIQNLASAVPAGTSAAPR
jgi:cysteinyl-tRNA synthetase